jgi:hypothetical protein
MSTQEASKIVDLSSGEVLVVHCALWWASWGLFLAVFPSTWTYDPKIVADVEGFSVFVFLATLPAPIASLWLSGFSWRARYIGLACGEGVSFLNVLFITNTGLLTGPMPDDTRWSGRLALVGFLSVFVIVFILPVVVARYAMRKVRTAEARNALIAVANKH